MRNFNTGATRDSEDGKLDYDGFLSPTALKRYAQYLNSHRIQADGKLRDSDNWQKGIPRDVYMKSLFRHFVDAWSIHRGITVSDTKDGHAINIEEALSAIIFNAFGYLHEQLKSGETAPTIHQVTQDVMADLLRRETLIDEKPDHYDW